MCVCMCACILVHMETRRQYRMVTLQYAFMTGSLPEPGAALIAASPVILLSLLPKCWGYMHVHNHTSVFWPGI